jgi:hypothetical protein
MTKRNKRIIPSFKLFTTFQPPKLEFWKKHKDPHPIALIPATFLSNINYLINLNFLLYLEMLICLNITLIYLRNLKLKIFSLSNNDFSETWWWEWALEEGWDGGSRNNTWMTWKQTEFWCCPSKLPQRTCG